MPKIPQLLADTIDFASTPMYLILLVIISIVFIAIIAKYIGLWFQAFVSGTPISLINIIGMGMRKFSATHRHGAYHCFQSWIKVSYCKRS